MRSAQAEYVTSSLSEVKIVANAFGKIITTSQKSSCIDDAGAELCEECLLYTVWFVCTKVVTDDRLSALTDSLKRQGNELTDTCDDRHCSNGHVTAKSGKAACKTDGQKALR